MDAEAVEVPLDGLFGLGQRGHLEGQASSVPPERIEASRPSGPGSMLLTEFWWKPSQMMVWESRQVMSHGERQRFLDPQGAVADTAQDRSPERRVTTSQATEAEGSGRRLQGQEVSPRMLIQAVDQAAEEPGRRRAENGKPEAFGVAGADIEGGSPGERFGPGDDGDVVGGERPRRCRSSRA